MPDLDFRVESVAPIAYAAVPLLGFRIAIANANAEEPIFSVSLRCQIQIEVTRRRYTPQDQEHLLDLFGQPERWSQTLRNMLWTNVTATAAPFIGKTTVEAQVPCTFDFDVASTKYFYGLEGGEIPLCFLFSGTIFYDAGTGAPQVAPIPWSKESRFRMPVETWRSLIDTYYPNHAWLRLRRDVFDRLSQYKMRHGLPSWEAALERILEEHEEIARA
ncbi:MAG TPA: DUF6084 family protein [Bryobacteraceae bacterium]|nr:DUF6084 family protein [Bryobacteraceae bacterium]